MDGVVCICLPSHLQYSLRLQFDDFFFQLNVLPFDDHEVVSRPPITVLGPICSVMSCNVCFLLLDIAMFSAYAFQLPVCSFLFVSICLVFLLILALNMVSHII